MGEFFAALFIGLLGLSLLLGGYYFARVLISIWGFFWGFLLGASFFTNSTNSFMGTTLGIVSGLVLGLVLAIVAYMYYYAAVVVLFGGLGYAIAGSLFAWLGLGNGVVTTIIGIVVAVLFSFLAIVASMPKVTLIVISSFMGAVLIVGAILLLFNQIPLDAFSYTTAKLAVSYSWFWSIIVAVLTIAGIGTQYATSQQIEFDEWDTEEFTPHTHSGTYHHA